MNGRLIVSCLLGHGDRGEGRAGAETFGAQAALLPGE